MKQLLVSIALLFGTVLHAQDIPTSEKLEKEKGFGLLQLGAVYSKVKTILQKDSIKKKDSFEPGAQTMKSTRFIYLANLKIKECATFCGRAVARVEVWFTEHYNEEGEKTNDYEISEVKVFFKAVSDKDTKEFFDKLFNLYGVPTSLIYDTPEKGDTIITWFCSTVLMNGTSFRGDMASEEIKRDYFCVKFEASYG